MGKLLTIQQLSERLEMKPRTIYDWVHIGFIPHYKFPKGIRFRISDIEIWLRHRKKKGRGMYRRNITN